MLLRIKTAEVEERGDKDMIVSRLKEGNKASVKWNKRRVI